MPERIIQEANQWLEALKLSAAFALVGLLIGIGQLMASKEQLTWKIIIGRALSTSGFAMAAGVALLWFPDMPLVAQLGVAAALASLGTSGVERLVQRLFGIGQTSSGG